MLYWIEHQKSNKYAYAYKDLSFIGFDRSTICQNCNRPIVFPKFSTEVPCLCIEGLDNYPDYLQFCGAGRQMYLVSERTLNLYERNHISGYSNYSLVTISLERRGYPAIDIPRYYSLHITGNVDLDLSSMRLKKKKTCTFCKQFDWNRQRMDPFILDYSSWDGSDLCLLQTFQGFTLCSLTAKELMIGNNLTGFSFRSALSPSPIL